MSGTWWILLGALLWSTGGVGVKFLQMPELAIAGSRSFVSGLFFLLVGWRDVWSGRPHRLVWLGAGAYAMVVGTFVVSTKMTTAANAILLQYTAPLWVALLGSTVGEKPRLRELGMLAAGGVGVVVCMSEELRNPFVDGFTRAALGDLIALFSGVVFAVLILVMRRSACMDAAESRRFNWQVLAIGNFAMAAAGAPAMAQAADAGAYTGTAALLLLWLGLFQLGGGYVSFQRGVRTVPALRASILSLVEPVLNPVWVALAVGEVPGQRTLIGGALVISAVAVGSIGAGGGDAPHGGGERSPG